MNRQRFIMVIAVILILAIFVGTMPAERIMAAVKPSKPKISAKIIDDKIRLTIRKTKNAEGLYIYVKKPSDSKYRLAADLDEDGTENRFYEFSNLTEGTYSIKVRGYFGERLGKFSKIKKVRYKKNIRQAEDEGDNKDCILYIKDREVYYYDNAKNETKKITTGFGSDLSNSELKNKDFPFYIANNGECLVCPDGKGKGGALYVCNIDNPLESTIKIADNIDDNYFINFDGTVVTSVSKDGVLSQYNFDTNRKEILNAAVDDDYINTSKDGNTLVYRDMDSGLYLKKKGEKIQVIYSDNVDNDGFFVRDNGSIKVIFQWQHGGEEVFYIYEEGKGIWKLDIPEEKDSWQLLCVGEKGDAYYAKEDGLFYYDGIKSKKIASNVGDVHVYDAFAARPIVWYTEHGTNKKYVAVGDKKMPCDGTMFQFIEDSDELYYVVPNEGNGTLYKIKISDIGSEKTVKCYENVDSYIVFDNNTVISLKYTDKKIANVYVNGKLIVSNTKIENELWLLLFRIYRKVYLESDYDEVNKTYTLYQYSDGQLIKISEGVRDAQITPEGNILYLKNYDDNKCLGDLYYYDGISKKIDENVIAIPFVLKPSEILTLRSRESYLWSYIGYR